MQTDVTVVGYGPVGALTALLLGRAGVDCVVVDRRDVVHPLPRAVAADDEVLRLLAAAGLGDEVAQMLPVPGARFTDRDGRPLLDLDFDGSDSGHPGLALFRQPDLERALRAAVQRTPVTPLLGVDVASLTQDEDGVTLGLTDGSLVRSRYAVGCDGARSTVRGLLDVPTHGPRAVQRWLVVDVLTHERPPQPDRVTYVCDPDGAVVTMPVPGGRRFEFLLPGSQPEQPRTEPSAAEVEARLAPYLAGVPAVVERVAAYDFRVRVARRWRVGRVLLAGDAAHTMPPFAGQGLSAGLRDAENLAWKLGLAVRGCATDELLDSYERERRPHLAKMVRLSRVTGALVTAPCTAGSAVRNATLLAAASTPGLAEWLRRGGPRPGETLRRVEGCPLRARGGLVPNALVTQGLPEASRLDDHLGSGFALLGLDVDPVDVLPPAVSLFWSRLGTRTVQVRTASAGAAADVAVGTGAVTGEAVLHDVAGQLSPLGAPGDVLVVRPDRKVLAAGPPERVLAATRAFAALTGDRVPGPVPEPRSATTESGSRGPVR